MWRNLDSSESIVMTSRRNRPTFRWLAPAMIWLAWLAPVEGVRGQSTAEQQGGKTGAKKTRPPEERLEPIVEIQSEDYAKARDSFKTNLIRKVPSPQPVAAPPKVPAGVTEEEFSSGDLKLKAWLHRPANGDKKRPAVLFLHGGFAFEQDDWDLTKPYRDAGFVVMTPILRGENGQPGSFTLWYDEVDDVLAAADYLSKQPFVDAGHLYIAGSSSGGTLALLAAEASKLFRAAASFSASPDQALLVKHAKMDLPFDKTNARELQLRSPLAFAGSLKCPTRIYYATQDHFVLSSQKTAETAKAKKLDVEAIRIEGDHGSIVPPGILQSIEFFRKQSCWAGKRRAERGATWQSLRP
jgi:dipeptidyl aminopeptidase/acylaminoacyl peptidase